MIARIGRAKMRGINCDKSRFMNFASSVETRATGSVLVLTRGRESKAAAEMREGEGVVVGVRR
jgi:hypothetical protein